MGDSTDFRIWLKRAAEDLQLLTLIKEHGVTGLENSFCYTAHQYVEKSLKAYLLKYGEAPVRSHSLMTLTGVCLKHDGSFESLKEDMAMLESYAVTARYPDEIELNSNADHVYQAWEAVNRFKSFITGKIEVDNI